MEYYSVIKNNEIMMFVGKWMELEILILSKFRQTEKTSINVFYMWNLIKKKRTRHEGMKT
jgi:hypothetical protein